MIYCNFIGNYIYFLIAHIWKINNDISSFLCVKSAQKFKYIN